MRIHPDGCQFPWRLCRAITVAAPSEAVSCPLERTLEARPAQEVCAAAGTARPPSASSPPLTGRSGISFWFSYALLPFTVTGGSRRQKRPRLLDIFLCPTRENGPPIEEPSREITNLLRAWSGGDHAALDRLAERVYPELRRMARRYMKNERQANTLQSTALVHEVYLRLVDVRKVEWRERAQFYAMAAQMMRRILVDAARARGSQKRGGSAADSEHRRHRGVVSRAGPVDSGVGRGPHGVLAPRAAAGQGCRVALFWRPDGRGNRRACWTSHRARSARLGFRQSLAGARVEPAHSVGIVQPMSPERFRQIEALYPCGP